MSEKQTFIHELPLHADPHAARSLDIRLDMARQLYNAGLGEALRRLALMRESESYQAARKLPKVDKAARQKAFKALIQQYGFSEYALHQFEKKTRNACAIGEHIDAFTGQKVVSRAFSAVKEYQLGKRGRPRFKGTGQFVSLEGKSNTAGIRWRDDHVVWNGIELHPIFDCKDKHGIQAHALASEVKYTRLVKRSVRGRARWFAQLVLDGVPKIKRPVAAGVVGLDLGPSTIAAVAQDSAILRPFAPEVDEIGKRLRIVQRAMDRSRRALNPQNFNADGTVKKGTKRWMVSTSCLVLKTEAAELQRVMAVRRKHSHGKLANEILAMGTTVRTEVLSYRAFQKNFGKSVGRRAPGMFVEMLRRKAANAGGAVEEFDTRRTRLSQTCHCGAVAKKKLSQRWHVCNCGVQAQRDLYSAFLARYVRSNTLDMRQAQEAWPVAHTLLERAVLRLQQQAANGWMIPASLGVNRRGQRRSPVKGGSRNTEAADVVTLAQAGARAAEMSCACHQNPLELSGGSVRL